MDILIGGLAVTAIAGILIAGFYSAKLLAAGFEYAEARRATAECEKWEEWSRVFPDFYMTEWQKSQCDYHGVAIDAPIK